MSPKTASEIKNKNIKLNYPPYIGTNSLIKERNVKSDCKVNTNCKMTNYNTFNNLGKTVFSTCNIRAIFHFLHKVWHCYQANP